MSDLLDLINQKHQRIQQKEAEKAALEGEIAQLHAEMAEAREILRSLMPPASAGTSGAPRQFLSTTDMAEAVLTELRHAAHVNELITEIYRRFNVSVKYATLVGNISRLVKKGKTFERIAPNVFGLLVWDEGKQLQDEKERLFG